MELGNGKESMVVDSGAGDLKVRIMKEGVAGLEEALKGLSIGKNQRAAHGELRTV
jgi:hypothetical protein